MAVRLEHCGAAAALTTSGRRTVQGAETSGQHGVVELNRPAPLLALIGLNKHEENLRVGHGFAQAFLRVQAMLRTIKAA